MSRRATRSPPKPLDDASLRALALFYVGRYATTQANLVRYLNRKLRERGWNGENPPAPDDIGQNFAELGYVDDRVVAESKTRGLKQKGLGAARIRQKLGEIGIGRDLAGEVAALQPDEAEALAMRLAQRRRIGPFSVRPPGEKDWQRWMGVMLRAGHDPGLARDTLRLSPEEALKKVNGQS
jgi:regulatory protein